MRLRPTRTTRPAQTRPSSLALVEGQCAGEFFTPMSIVRLIVEIIEPFHGRIFDPACGSGGMFVQSAHFVERHRRAPGDELSIYGQEKTGEKGVWRR